MQSFSKRTRSIASFVTTFQRSYANCPGRQFKPIVGRVTPCERSTCPALLSEQDKQAYATALAQTKQETQASRKIEVIRDLIPASLRPHGINPLRVLHDALSVGIHSREDEECLEQAATIRESLVFFITQLDALKTSSQQFTEHMRKQLDRKSEKGQ